MVDRINKVTPDHIRVDEAKDALEEESQQASPEDDGAEPDSKESPPVIADAFDRNLEKTDWKLYLDQAKQNKAKISVLSPESKVNLHDEVTRVTSVPENTFSQTLKQAIKKTWIQFMGLQDAETKRFNSEVIFVYVTIIVVVLFFVFAVMWLIR